MADKKISELNTASAVYDADDFALVQDGETKQVNASTVKAYAKDGLSKSDVGLGNVDNTSDANKPVSTATQTALDGKENADVTILKSAAIGVSVQAYSANLSEYAAVNPTTAGLALLDDADAAAQRTTLGLVIGTNVQAYDADLTAWAGKTAPTGDAVGTSDTQTLTNKTISGSSNTLSNIANASLTNSAITFGATSQALGSTVSVLNGVSLGQGTNGAAAGKFTTLEATGNTTLGDASGDTLTINGTAVSAPNGLNVNSNQLVLSSGNLMVGTQTARSTLTVSFADTSGNGITLVNSNNANNTTKSSNLDYSGTDTGGTYKLAGYVRMLPADANYVGSNLTFGVRGSDTVLERGRFTSKGLLVGYTDDSGLSGVGNAIFSGNVGIGTGSTINQRLDVVKDQTSGDLTTMRQFRVSSTTNAGYAGFIGYGLPTNGTSLGLVLQSLDNTAISPIYAIGSSLLLRQSSNTANTSVSFNTTIQNALTLDASGNLLVGGTVSPSGAGNIVCESATGKVGYGTGAGGTVTQATSKSTAVTLNKPCGKITTHNEPLNNGDIRTFQVVNSSVGPNDTVILTVNGNFLGYALRCTVYTGEFYIRLENTSGGTLTEAVVINFAVIRGATS